MNWIGTRRAGDRPLIGFWLSAGSEVIAEMAGLAGFDWVLLDMEHGVGDYHTLLHQLQALSGTHAAAIVRVVSNDPEHIRRALDLGAAGIMIPRVNSVHQARDAVAATRYGPSGLRGISSAVRAGGFGLNFEGYAREALTNLRIIVQIETVEAVESADAIGAVEGVDGLFIGPADLTHEMGIDRQLDHPRFIDACQHICKVCRKHRKLAGILLKDVSRAVQAAEDGFSFLAVGSDVGLLVSGMRSLMQKFSNGC